ncbi:MAG: family 10 glycosylhydrolase [Clostridia bacterium]|nr:family 10 glycosylhydrolase [Clostridia bacterium]
MKRTKRVIAIILTVAFIASLLGIMPALSQAEGGKVKAAVFSVDGTGEQVVNDIAKWLNEYDITADETVIESIEAKVITVDDILAGALSEYDTLIIADACSASIQMGKTVMNALGSEAVVKIQDYIAAGGGYIGIGGGAYAATHTFTTAGDTNTFMNLTRFRVDYPVWNHGGGEIVAQVNNKSHAITKGMQTVRKYLAFTDAPPILKEITSTSMLKDTRAGVPTVLMKYYSNLRNGLGASVNVNQNAYTNMTNTPALAVSTFGAGRVVITGMLLQASQTTNLEFLLGRSVLYTAGFNNIVEVEKSVEQKKFDVVGEWVWASEITSKGTNGANIVAERCKEYGVTDIYLLVKGNGGKVCYNRGVVPLGRENTSRDVLQEMITAGHKYGIRVHAWISVLNDEAYAANHIEETLYHYKRGYTSRETGNDWATMDPTLPNFADYTQRLLAELVTNYDVDGIHFDYIRYNHIAYGWSEANIIQMEDEYGINVATLKSYVDGTYYNSGAQASRIFRMAASGECGYGEGIDATRFMQMRCDNIKKFARGLVDAIRAADPDVIISAALMPEGAYEGHHYITGRNDNQTASNTYGRMVFGQDYHDTAELYDYVCPMAYSYTFTASTQWMAAMAENAAQMGNKVVMGMQAFTPADGTASVTSKVMMEEVEQLRKVASSDGVLGFALFRQGLYIYSKATYSPTQNLVKLTFDNAFSNSVIGKTVIEMNDGMKAKEIISYDNIRGAEAVISEDGKTITLEKGNLMTAGSKIGIILSVEGEMNKAIGPCFVNVYSSNGNETRAYQIFEEGMVELPPPPTPLPTVPGAIANFTMQEVLDTATQLIDEIKTTGGYVPNTIKIGDYNVSKPSLSRIFSVALHNASLRADRKTLVSYINCTAAGGANSHTLSSQTISKDGYLYAAEKQLTYIDNNNYRPASYISYPGDSGLKYTGNFGFEYFMRVAVRALNFYNTYDVLPDEVSVMTSEGATPTPPPKTPEPTPTPEQTPPPGVVLGDINLDGKTNSKDIALLQRHVLGTSLLEGAALVPADLNADGKINSKDISALQRKVLA